MRILLPVILGLAALALVACSKATPSPTSDIPGGATTGIQIEARAATPTDSSELHQNLSTRSSPNSADQDSTANSIDVVYSTVASIIGGDPLSPLFGDWPQDRSAIGRLASALENAVPITPTVHLKASDRGRYLRIVYGDGTELMVRQVSWCEDWGGQRDFIGGACRGEHKPLTDIWWVEGTGMIESSALGLWWGEMTVFMVPISEIFIPKSLEPGKIFTVNGYDWTDQIETPTMNLSLVSADGHEFELAALPVEAGYLDEQAVVPDGTPRGRYWLRVSGGSFSELVDVVQVE